MLMIECSVAESDSLKHIWLIWNSMHRISSLFFVYKFQKFTDNYVNFKKVCLKFPLSPHTMLWTHNIAWRNFCSLSLNIVKRVKETETKNRNHVQIAVFPINFVTDCWFLFQWFAILMIWLCISVFLEFNS